MPFCGDAGGEFVEVDGETLVDAAAGEGEEGVLREIMDCKWGGGQA